MLVGKNTIENVNDLLTLRQLGLVRPCKTSLQRADSVSEVVESLNYLPVWYKLCGQICELSFQELNEIYHVIITLDMTLTGSRNGNSMGSIGAFR